MDADDCADPPHHLKYIHFWTLKYFYIAWVPGAAGLSVD